MNTAIILITRYDSTRLKGKHVLEINGETMTDILIKRLKKSGLPVIMATPFTDNDRTYMFPIAKRNGIGYFAGDVENILERQRNCAKQNNIDYIVTVEGDDILTCPSVIKEMRGIIDWVTPDVIRTAELPIGLNVIGYKTEVIENIDSDVSTGWCNKVHNMPCVMVNYRLNREYWLTMDYPQDFELVKHILLNCADNETPQGIINYLDENPEIAQINAESAKIYWEAYRKRLKGNPDNVNY
jgi:spore coat polysaccharide biosynthesis protein SpsF